MRSLFFAIIAAPVLLGGAASASTIVTVPGNSNPYLSGLPDGTMASFADAAPDQSPVQVTDIPINGGDMFTFSVTGFSSNTGAASGPSPDGGAVFSHFPGAQNGMSDITAPINSLVGVFLTDAVPDTVPAPAALDFSTAPQRDFDMLMPDAQQVFFIGDGMRDDGTLQSFVAPDDATRLFLATMDGFGWFNNSGAFEVTINGVSMPPMADVPLPAGGLLLLTGLGAMAVARRRMAKG